MPGLRPPTLPIPAAAAALRAVIRCPPARRALRRRGAALLMAAAAATWVHREHTDALALEHRWDASVAVVVTRRAVPAGTAMGATDLEVQRRPASLVPDGALSTVPSGRRRATVDLAAGEVVVAGRVRTGGTIAARVPPGHSAVTLAVEGGLPPVERGDRVDVLAAGTATDRTATAGTATDSTASASAPMVGTAGTVASDAVVVDVPDDGDLSGSHRALTVAVTDEDVGIVTAALLAGPVAVVLRSPADP